VWVLAPVYGWDGVNAEGVSRRKPGPGPVQLPQGWSRRFPVGAELAQGIGAHFRVWAPQSPSVSVLLGAKVDFTANTSQEFELAAEGSGYFSGWVPGAQAGMCYQFKLQSGCFPDPASRFQPAGPHGPSQLIDATRFDWTDQDWPGITRTTQAIYELHIGTFTRQGTWTAAQGQLPQGRRQFLSQFPSVACAWGSVWLSAAGGAETFIASKLDLSERERHPEAYRFHKDLLWLRRRDPVFSRPSQGTVDGAVLAQEAFVLRFFGPEAND
jgi:Domain of unknown function (DUF3459)